MLAQFTDRARKVTALAFQESHRLGHKQVDSGHLLLGIIKEGDGVAAHVLKDLGIDLGDVRREVEILLFSSGPGMTTVGNLSYTSAAAKVLQYATEEATSLNHNFVGSEHLLLGMLHDGDSVVAQALRKVGLEQTTVRAATVQLLGGPRNAAKRPRPLPSHISVGPLGRAVLGLCAFLSSLAFGAFSVCLGVRLAAVGLPQGKWRVVLVHLVIDVFAVASIFMLLIAISFWAGGSRWTDWLLLRTMRKGAVAVGVIVTAILVIASTFLVAQFIADPRIVFAVGGAVGLVISVSFIVLIRE